MTTQTTAKSEAMQAVRLLRGHALATTQGLTQAQVEALYQASKLLEKFIETCTELPVKPKWRESETPYSDVEIGGFTLMDEVSIEGRSERWFVVGLHTGRNQIICNSHDYHNPLQQLAFQPDELTFVSHGKSE